MTDGLFKTFGGKKTDLKPIEGPAAKLQETRLLGPTL
jgi:hypothetical protein